MKQHVATTPIKPKSETSSPTATPATNETPTQQTTAQIPFKNIQELANYAREKSERILAFNIETFMRPIRLEPGLITCSLAPNTPNNFVSLLTKFLRNQTGINWTIKTEKEGGQPSVKEQKESTKQQLINEVKKDPAGAEIEKLFSGAKIEKIKPLVAPEDPEDEPAEEDT